MFRRTAASLNTDTVAWLSSNTRPSTAVVEDPSNKNHITIPKRQVYNFLFLFWGHPAISFYMPRLPAVVASLPLHRSQSVIHVSACDYSGSVYGYMVVRHKMGSVIVLGNCPIGTRYCTARLYASTNVSGALSVQYRVPSIFMANHHVSVNRTTAVTSTHMNDTSRPMKGKQCYNCGKPGHIKRDCRMSPKQKQEVVNLAFGDGDVIFVTGIFDHSSGR